MYRSEGNFIRKGLHNPIPPKMEIKKMTTSELNQISCTTTWTRQFLRIQKLRIDHGDMDRLDRMHSEIFMSNIQKIADSVRDIKTDNDIMYTKDLVRDLMDDLRAPGGLVLEKIEGAAVLPNGDVLIVNDNDGVDGSNGETQLLNLGQLLN